MNSSGVDPILSIAPDYVVSRTASAYLPPIFPRWLVSSLCNNR
jgi:hypothetical protein